MKNFFNSLKTYYGVLLFALLFMTAGVCLIAFPEDALPTAVLTISIITIVSGVIMALIALLDKKRQAKFFFLLLGGACALFAGIFLLIKRNDDAVALLALFIGVVMMIDGSFKLHEAVKTKQFKNAVWWILLVLSMLTIVGGLYLIKWIDGVAVKTCSILMGVFMIIDAIQNVFITFYTPYYERKQKREILAEAAAGDDDKDGNEVIETISADTDNATSETVKEDCAEIEAAEDHARKTESKKRGFSLFGKRKKAEKTAADDETVDDNAPDSVNAEPDVDMPAELDETDDVIETVVVKPDDENNEN